MEYNGKKIASVLVCLALIVTLFAAVPLAASAATPAQIDVSAGKGLAWLAAQQQADGSWGPNYQPATTGFAVLIFEQNASNHGKSPLDPTYQYATNVKAGLDYLFSAAQLSGDTVSWSNYNYYTSAALIAIVASSAPNTVVSGTGPLAGMTYKQVAQDVVNYFVAGQQTSTYTGSWGYDNSQVWGDQSNTGYVTLALAYAESPTYTFGIAIPASVKTNLLEFATAIQDPNGGAYYQAANGVFGTDTNLLRTGYLLDELQFCGVPQNDPRVHNATTFIADHWNDASAVGQEPDPGWNGTVADYQATLAMLKGFEAYGITTITTSGGTSIDWFSAFSDAIVAQQQVAGSWPQSSLDPANTVSSEWAIMTILRITAAPNQPPVANAGPDQTVTVNTKVTLNGTGSTDPDNNLPLTYAWSIQSAPAGSRVQLSSSTAGKPTFTPDKAGDYVFALTVKDSLGLQSQTADTVKITAKAPPTTTVRIDIDPTLILPKTYEIVAVTIVSNKTNGFDPLKVVPATVRFGHSGTEASPVGAPLKWHDDNHDGMKDLTLFFWAKDTRLLRTDKQAMLTGKTTAGTSVHGSAKVWVIA